MSFQAPPHPLLECASLFLFNSLPIAGLPQTGPNEHLNLYRPVLGKKQIVTFACLTCTDPFVVPFMIHFAADWHWSCDLKSYPLTPNSKPYPTLFSFCACYWGVGQQQDARQSKNTILPWGFSTPIGTTSPCARMTCRRHWTHGFAAHTPIWQQFHVSI